jgi:uncharacterized protein with NRDE domain
VLAANRDEFHARPAAALHWWESPRMLAGRDLEAGGTWLAAGPGGRFGVITNYRDLDGPVGGAPSRGRLIPEYIDSGVSPEAFATHLAPQLHRYSGFNLLVGDASRLYYIANRAAPPARELPPGIYGLSNHLLDTPWPKLVRARTRFERALTGAQLHGDGLMEILTDREPASETEEPAGGLPRNLARALSATFVVNDRFGTRCSTVLLIRHDGSMEIAEQSYDATGSVTGNTAFKVSD